MPKQRVPLRSTKYSVPVGRRGRMQAADRRHPQGGRFVRLGPTAYFDTTAGVAAGGFGVGELWNCTISH